MNVTISIETNFKAGLRHSLSQLLSRGSRRSLVQRVSSGSAFETTEPAAAEAPLPPCRPLNASEQEEAAMLALLRGALYSKPD